MKFEFDGIPMERQLDFALFIHEMMESMGFNYSYVGFDGVKAVVVGVEKAS